ncbi:MAG: substrate-binding domain-containing protein, partial [Rhodobacteraceae bacterium]|nr:substrate-binding domain-containing protein [Paracoccaceae bacterium]
MRPESIDKNRLVSSVFTQGRHHHAYKFHLIHAARVIISCLCLICMGGWATAQEVPVITGEAKFDGAAPLLDWPRDYGRKNPNLEEPSANILFDLHAQIRECDIALSTSGNFHMALLDLWKEEFLPSFPEDAPIGNWMYTTSPPISVEQLQEGHVQFGNFLGACPVQVAGGPGRVMNKLKDMGVVEGDPLPLLSNYGNVLLVKKGNPKNIQSIWDLGREDVTVVTSNPVTEAGSFSNYRDSIYHIALNDPEPPEGMTAEKLFDRVFNGATGREGKWVSGARIHHREAPWSIAYGQA